MSVYFAIILKLCRRTPDARIEEHYECQSFAKARNAVIQKSPYKWTWMRKSSHPEKDGRLLILSWNFGFGIAISKMWEIQFARELIPKSLSLQRRRLYISRIPEFKNSYVFKTISTWGSTQTDTPRAAWTSQTISYMFFELMVFFNLWWTSARGKHRRTLEQIVVWPSPEMQ